MEPNKISLHQWANVVEKLLQSISYKTYYAIADKPIVLMSDDTIIDQQAAEDRHYSSYMTKHNGGAIVLNKGDVGIAHIGTPDKRWHDFFIKEFIFWLQEKGLNAYLDSNDIVIDGYKVCGISVRGVGAIEYTAGIIGINTKLTDIQAICTKEMKKIPKGLSDYDITTEEVEEWFLNFCNKCKQLHII